MNDLTELVFILDRSGSMFGLEADTIGGFNAMLEKQKQHGTPAILSTVLFNNRSSVLHDRLPLDTVPPLTENDYEVSGSTALLDAVGDAVKHIRMVHRCIRPEDVPAHTLFIITTDGMENSSLRFTYKDVHSLIEGQKKAGWEFLFLGANIDAAATARNFGISEENAVDFINDRRGIHGVYSCLAATCCHFMDTGRIEHSWKKSIREDHALRSGKTPAGKAIPRLSWHDTLLNRLPWMQHNI